ncbi:hypothetical protein AUJ68_02680 [Candidatus Woesearchaeota archaeon CG1_02_57_44]|nr:MAG: hypothetical protein AUJ68_02680 [Candidatus Woesearchaeota archaeon CG1_02_57_44]
MLARVCEELLSSPENASAGCSETIQHNKIHLSKKYGLGKIPSDIELFLHCPPELIGRARMLLQTKPIRTQSGVAPIAVMVPPRACPHGRCTYCPGGPGSVFGDTPQSYTGKEPSTMRAIRNSYDPYLIVMNRLEHLVAAGHYPGKAELIIQGGTFPAMDKTEQDGIITDCLKAMDDFGDLFLRGEQPDYAKFKAFFELPGSVKDEQRGQRIRARLLELKEQGVGRDAAGTEEPDGRSNGIADSSSPLLREQRRNETAGVRCVALAIETKPDWGLLEHGLEMLRQGTTRIELGIQTLYDEPLRLTNRGHTLQDSRDSSRILRDLGFKLTYHIMLGLPGVTKEMDAAVFKDLFNNPDWMPDSLKIYPCMVFPGTSLYQQWKRGKYAPLTTKEAASIIAEGTRHVPDWCRIMRVQRDIPSFLVEAGVDKTNLRQYVEQERRDKSIQSRDIRDREPKGKHPESITYRTMSYEASGGVEFFIAAEDTTQDLLLGFCRLRLPGQELLPELKGAAIVRELHVYGEAVPLGDEGVFSGAVQHRGIGKALLGLAEGIAREHHKQKVVVISGIGVREYYRRLGYNRDGLFMSRGI